MTEGRQETFGVSDSALDHLMPLHLYLSPTGHILRVGPTLAKLFPDQDLCGLRFLEVMEVKHPQSVQVFADIAKFEHTRLRVAARMGHNYVMKGLFARLPDGGALVNLSLGISVMDAVNRFELSSADFAPSDPTVDMLYLMEAKTAALDESEQLNKRLQCAKTAAEEQAYTDTLTGLKNRRAMDHLLGDLARDNVDFGLMHLDLDFFKQVNDTLGHAAGDHVLQYVADVLLKQTRKNDMVARVGGDEFVLIFHGCVDLEVINRIARRIIAKLEKPILFQAQTCHISASIGTTLSSFYANPSTDKMLSDADQALYASKRHGRACHTVFEPNMC